MDISDRVDSGRTSLSVLTLVCVTVAFCMTGCSTAGYRKSDAAAMTMRSAALEVQAESSAIDATLNSLRGLVLEPGNDLKKPYQQFSLSLAHMGEAARRTENTGRLMAQRSAAYFQAWDKQIATIDYEHIRELSQARKTEAVRHFDTVNQRYVESQEVVQPLITYLQDIQKALGSDLTTSGLGSMKEVVQNADANAAKVQTALKVLVDELNDSGSRFSTLVVKNRGTVQ